ncbi:MAG: hypothetical protein EOO25_21030 [Comamonadaceae bacterium]|nr:MAG: hypothetical protein EOO25_21030 [Comamonadaceae bacterium]
MWQERRAELARQQELLLERSQALRVRLGREALVLERPLALADRARSQLHWWRAHPLRLAGLALLPLAALVWFTARRPRRLLGTSLRVSLRLWSAWRAWRSVRALLQRGGGAGQAPWNAPVR